MTEGAKIAFEINFILVSLGFILYGLYKVPAGIRILRIKSLAKKYGLKYQRIEGETTFAMKPTEKLKRNKINGIINGNEIKIYDYSIITDKGSRIIAEYHTVFIFNQNRQDIIGVWGSVRIGTIANWLKKIKENNTISTTDLKINQPHKAFLKFAVWTLLVLIVLLIIISTGIVF